MGKFLEAATHCCKLFRNRFHDLRHPQKERELARKETEWTSQRHGSTSVIRLAPYLNLPFLLVKRQVSQQQRWCDPLIRQNHFGIIL